MNIIKIKNIYIKINISMLAAFILFILCGFFIEIIIITFTILIHELFHSIVAKKYGFEVEEIEIFPFGGIARFEQIKTIYPKEEIFICIVGPLSNFIIALIFIGIKSFYFHSYLIDYIIKVNILMFTINILPIFPLDGGKIIRSLLSLFIGYKSSTIKLTYITYILCTIVILYDILNGLTVNGIYFSLIAVFTIIAAKKEREMAAFVFIKSITRKTKELHKKKNIKVHILVCMKTLNIKETVDFFLPNKYHIFIIINTNGDTIGTLTENQLIEGIYSYGFDITLEELLIETQK
ncbi:MAG: M50 family metallopeptidase [Tissierellales bacterium]